MPDTAILPYFKLTPLAKQALDRQETPDFGKHNIRVSSSMRSNIIR